MIKALENGVSQFPKLEGRFPQVAGISYVFDPSKPAGERVAPELVKIQDEYVENDKVGYITGWRKLSISIEYIL